MTKHVKDLIIKNHAYKFKTREFDTIPSVLFKRILEASEGKLMHDDILELIDSPIRTCPECGDGVEQRKEGQCEEDCPAYKNGNGPCRCDVGDDEHHWECCSCEANSIEQECSYESLAPRDAEHDWPTAHSFLFWTTRADVEKVAAECGFYVFNSSDIQGTLLGIDGGGYDFVEDHWVPLYLALGLTWHEEDELWDGHRV